jgi:hypothetical protein
LFALMRAFADGPEEGASAMLAFMDSQLGRADAPA